MTRIRPAEFQINSGAQLAQGSVFAGLGRHTGSTYFHDSSLYKNHGTLTNMDPATDWVWVPKLGRWAVYLRGSPRYIGISPIVLSGSKTVSWWISYEALGYVLGGAGVHQYPYMNDNTLYVRDDVIAESAAHGGTASVWIHYAISGNEATVRYYRNGVQIATDIPDPSPTVSRIATNEAGASYLRGHLADLMVYKRVLSSAEIAHLADPSNVMLSGLILPPRRRVFLSAGAPPTGGLLRHRGMAGGMAELTGGIAG